MKSSLRHLAAAPASGGAACGGERNIATGRAAAGPGAGRRDLLIECIAAESRCSRPERSLCDDGRWRVRARFCCNSDLLANIRGSIMHWTCGGVLNLTLTRRRLAHLDWVPRLTPSRERASQTCPCCCVSASVTRICTMIVARRAAGRAARAGPLRPQPGAVQGPRALRVRSLPAPQNARAVQRVSAFVACVLTVGAQTWLKGSKDAMQILLSS